MSNGTVYASSPKDRREYTGAIWIVMLTVTAAGGRAEREGKGAPEHKSILAD